MSGSIETIAPKLFATDFDGTCAQTFKPSPNNLDVHVAYQEAIVETFDAAALAQYLKDGGLNNRAPSEIVRSLQPDAPEAEQLAKTEELIAAKLGHLMSEIGIDSSGQMWPEPVPGFLEFWNVLKTHKESLPLTTAILSSGHTDFITKTFDLWEVEQPDIIVSDDTMRGLPDGCIAKNAVKPDPRLMRVVRGRWATLDPSSKGVLAAESIVYAGDDLAKDGGLAENSGVPFVHVTIETAHQAWQQSWNILGITGVASVK